ncbi:SDR family NAD(P)-dependent oxidoreductase [Pseudarthrobacter sp. CC12]|uniref:SDR family NAD(P)-dependent oxidoreductase n=1 Tax=Pseudarthrobacter sp. CC12 TaxID=3029193 RepID=UPI00326627D0
MSPHALITGAASGLGRQIAIRFAERGHQLTLIDLNSDLLITAAEACTEAGAMAVRSIAKDISTPEGPEEAVTEAWEASPIDVLINSAGIYPATPFLSLNAINWDAVLDVNTRTPVLATVALARKAVETGRAASIVNISSGAALRARPGAAPYSTSKAALEMATKAAALELGLYGIRVNAVAPGFVTVNSTANPVTEEYAAAVSDNPLGRRGEPDDIARAVVWLAGDEAAWITGETLRVDGGSSAGAWNLPLNWSPDATAGSENNVHQGSHAE